MPTPPPRRSLVVLNLPNSVPALIKRGRAIVTAMTGNPLLPAPNPPLAKVTAALDALDASETAAATRAKGTAEARNVAKLALISDLHDEKAYVQDVADADRENAEKIITSAAMSVKKTPARTKTDFEAKPGPTAGTVHLVARAASHRASYEWQYSTDAGKTWLDAPSTLQAKTTIGGLPVAASCQFRVRPVTKTGPGDWSQVISFVVS